jgi:hypothetical protein
MKIVAMVILLNRQFIKCSYILYTLQLHESENPAQEKRIRYER